LGLLRIIPLDRQGVDDFLSVAHRRERWSR
jgi:hypothetical protein